MINITVYVTSHCSTCKRVVSTLQSFSEYEPSISIIIIDITNSVSLVSVVPAIFLNEELYCYGEIDKVKLSTKINKLLS